MCLFSDNAIFVIIKEFWTIPHKFPAVLPLQFFSKGRSILWAVFFGAASQTDCVFDLFFGIDYHSHLGTRRAGMAVYSPETGFDKAIHNIENAPFRTKFTTESQSMHGTLGIGCISDYEAQPILVRSHHGTFAITTIGKINNANEIVEDIIGRGTHFFEMQNGEVNPDRARRRHHRPEREFIDGIRYAQESLTVL